MAADTSCVVRPYAPGDLVPAVALWYAAWHAYHPHQRHALPVESWRVRWREQLLLNAAVHVATIADALVGYVAAFPERPWLSHVIVTPDHRRRHIGTRLLQAAQAAAKPNHLIFDIFEDDTLSLAFYTHCGFTPGQTLSDPRSGRPMIRHTWSPPTRST
jgi:GNAT superfamily N-acetyltransferase